jgi:hypothetical protein
LREGAGGRIDRRLALVEHRAGELARLRTELLQTRRRVQDRLRELEREPARI